jgi:hypothetical protein
MDQLEITRSLAALFAIFGLAQTAIVFIALAGRQKRRKDGN